MADQGFDIPIRFPLDKAGAVDADKLLAQLRQQVKGVSDETKAYNDWLANNAKELGEVSKQQEAAVAELERYQATLEKMHQTQVLENHEKQKAVRWTQTQKDGQADLSKTLESLRDNVISNTKATDASSSAWAKNSLSLKDAKDGLKGLAFEIPVIGNLLKLLNPYTATVAGIAGATALWRTRVDELTTSLGGVPLPEVSEEYAARWERMAAAAGKIASDVAKIKAEKETFDKLLEVQQAFNLAAGFTSPDQVAGLKGQASREAAERLSVRSQQMLAVAGNINPNNPALADAEKLAAAAAGQIPGVRDRIAQITAAQGRRSMFGFNPMKWWDDTKLGIRYGGVGSYEEMLAMEESRLSGLQGTVSGYQGMVKSRAMRAANLEQGRAAGADAASFFDQAGGFQAQVASAHGADFKAAVELLATIDPLVTAQAITRMATAVIEAQKAGLKGEQDIRRAMEVRNQKP